MSNHAQEAIDWIEYSSNLNPDVDNKASHAAQLAQVHATLALVEQQRIANLIALGVLGEHAILTEQVSEDAAVSLIEHKDHAMGGYFQLKPEIAEALGIEQNS